MNRPSDIQSTLRESYRQIANDFSQSRSRAWPEFRFFLRFIPEECKLIDLGCGNGRFYGFLQQEERDIDYTGIDFCPELLNIAREKYPQQDFLEQDISEFDVNRRFDVAICIAAFHHLPSAKLRRQALRRIFDHLEDDGTLLISVWNLWQRRYWRQHLQAWWSWLKSGFRWSPRDLMIPFGKRAVPRYYHAFLPIELKKLLNQAGFRIDEQRVSGHNFLFVCRKEVAIAPGNPLFVREKTFTKPLSNHPVATSHLSS